MMARKIGECVKLKVSHPCTNESIPAVVRGLGLKKNDIVISIAGSGDMPFAIAPHVKKVYAVDNDKYQIEFMREQIDFLRRGDMDGFYRTDPMSDRSNPQKGKPIEGIGVDVTNMIQRKKYFSRRLKSIVGSLDKIDIVHEDIVSFLGGFSSDYSKFYASNVFDGMDCHFSNPRKAKLSVIDGLENMSVDGLFYVSRNTDNGFGWLPLCFIRDNDRTNSAWEAEKEFNSEWNWKPEVYRKRR